MEIILDFLDNSPSKTFLIPLKSTAFTALRMIYFKFDLDVHADYLTEFSLALTSSPFEWQNIRWLDAATDLQTLSKDGLIHVLLMKKYFLHNIDIQIARTNSFICSLLYSQFYKIFISSFCFIDYSILVYLSARLLQCEYFGCEISKNFLHSMDILSMILPPRFLEDCLIGYLILNCWHTLRHLPEMESRLIFVSDMLSRTKLHSHYIYDVFYGFQCRVILTVDQISFSYLETIENFEKISLSSLVSFSISSIDRSIFLEFDDKTVVFFSNFFIEITSLVSRFSNISPVNLDDSHTDVSMASIGMEYQLDNYLSFFKIEDFYPKILCATSQEDNLYVQDTIGLFPSNVPSPLPIDSTSNLVLEDSTTSLRYSDDEFDTDYDTLLLSNVTSAKLLPSFPSHLSEFSFTPATPCSDSLSRQHASYDYIDYKSQCTESEYPNPIYSLIYDSSNDNENAYIPCLDRNNQSMKSTQDITPPPLYSPCINFLSNFEYLGATYNDIQELGIDSRLSNGFRGEFRKSVDIDDDIFVTGNTNVYMHSESISKPLLLDSCKQNRHSKKMYVFALQNFAEYLSFHFIFYVLLPNNQIIQELVDIRTSPKALLLKLGHSLGLSHVLKDFSLIPAGISLDDSYNAKFIIQPNQVCQYRDQFSGDSNVLVPDTEFIDQRIKGSLVLHLKANSSFNGYVRNIPLYNREIIYFRCCMLILHGNIPMSLQHSVEFAAIQYQVYYSSRISDSNSLFCSPLEFISKEYKNVRGIAKQIFREQSALQYFSVSKAMDTLVHKFRSLPQSEYIFFPAREIQKKHMLKHPKLVHINLGVSLDGLITMHPITKRILSVVDYQSIKSWRYTGEAFIYENGHDENIVALKTIQGYCISTLITAHIHLISNTITSGAEYTYARSTDSLGKVSVTIVPEENILYESI